MASGRWSGMQWVAGTAPATPPSSDAFFTLASWSRGYLGFRSYLGIDAGEPAIVPSWSPDGLRWTEGEPLAVAYSGLDVEDVVEGPAGLVAVGRPSGVVMCECYIAKPVIDLWTSADGSSWASVDTTAAFGSGSVRGIAAGSPGYIAAGETQAGAPAVWLSADGASWHEAKLPAAAFKNAYLAEAAVFDGAYFVSGSIGSPDVDGGDYATTTPALWRSYDGVTWQRVALSGLAAGPVSVMSLTVIGQEAIVASVSDNRLGEVIARPVWISADGSAWERTTATSNPGSQILAFGRRTLLVSWVIGPKGEPDVSSLGPDLHAVRLVQSGDRPLEAWTSESGWSAALGPSGLVVTDATGSRFWVGVPAGD